jgi:predicted SAM-dependent methyltransferase
MIAQSWKDLWYLAWAPALRGNLYRHRLLSGENSARKLNIGCGTNQFEGWTNIDGNFLHRPDMWLDVRVGLPFSDKSVSVIYSCHFFEHLRLAEVRSLLRECRRALRKDGGLRIAVPNLRSAVEAYHAGNREWFNPFPETFQTLGGRFFNDMLCGDQHRLMFDYDFLAELLAESGFSTIFETERGESRLLPQDDPALRQELASDGGKTPDPWLLAEAIP